jgi:hypothetical protein
LKVERGREKLEQTTPKICKLPSFLQAKKYVDTIELNILKIYSDEFIAFVQCASVLLANYVSTLNCYSKYVSIIVVEDVHSNMDNVHI